MQIAWGIECSGYLPTLVADWLSERYCAWTDLQFLPSPLARIEHLNQAPLELRNAKWTPLPIQWHGQEAGLTVDQAVISENKKAQVWAVRAHQAGCLVRLDATKPAQVRFWGDDARLPLWVAITEVFRSAGWLTLHASAATGADDVTYLSLGRSGAGKSCRLIERLAVGGRPLGEDRVWLRASDLLLVARDSHVRLREEAFELFHHLDRGQATQDSDGKWRLSIAALGQPVAPPAVVQQLEVLRAPQEELNSALTTASQERLLVTQAVWEAVGLPFTDPARAQIQRAVSALLALPVLVVTR